MGSLGLFLMALVGPLARRVMLSLGLGVVSYALLAVTATQVVQQVQALYSGIGGPVVQLLDLIGFGQAIGIILGALVARAAFSAVSKIGLMTT